jgi:hypothetical protein
MSDARRLRRFGIYALLGLLAMTWINWHAKLMLADDTTTFIGVEVKRNGSGSAEIVAVLPDTPASSAGLKEHDEVVSVGEIRVENADQLISHIQHTPPDQWIALGIIRDGQQIAVAVKTAAKPTRTSSADMHETGTGQASWAAVQSTNNVAQSTAGERCAHSTKSFLEGLGITTVVLCVADLAFSGGLVCGSIASAAAAKAPAVAIAGCLAGASGASGINLTGPGAQALEGGHNDKQNSDNDGQQSDDVSSGGFNAD